MAGHYREVACKLAGIERKTLLNWLKRGEREQSGVYRDWYLAVERAEAEVFHPKNIETASAKSWFATAWFLERKHPERRGKREAPPAYDGPRDEVVGVDHWWKWRVWARGVPCPFWWWGLFGDEANCSVGCCR